MIRNWISLGVLVVFSLLLIYSERWSVPSSMQLLNKVAQSADSFAVSGVGMPLAARLVDPETLVELPLSVVRAQRVVQYCQWVESRGSDNKYRYAIRWTDKYIDSNYFHVRSRACFNPKPAPVEESVFEVRFKRKKK
jgi:hypothetical protein